MAMADVQACVDHLLMEQGAYEPAELLLLTGQLARVDYEAWRAGRTARLEHALSGDRGLIRHSLQAAADYAQRIGLEPDASFDPGRGEARNQGVSAHAVEAGVERLLYTAYRPAGERVQMDLFLDSGETRLINDLRQMLLAGRASEAAHLLHRQRHLRPDDVRLGAYERLLGALHRLQHPVADPACELRELEAIEPRAISILASRGRDFLAPLWRRLAQALEGQAFDPNNPRLHSSFAAGRALDWAAVRASVEAVAGWAQVGVLVGRHLQACERLHDVGAAGADCCRLCWDFPDSAPRALESSINFRAHWLAFRELDVVLETQDFPAYLALRAFHLDAPQGADNTHASQILALVKRLQAATKVEGPTREVIRLREQLKTEHPGLFQLVMAGARAPRAR